jgi:exonuclease SbcC
MKIAHLSDLHCCREHAEEALASLRFFTEQIKTSPVELVTISGDVWDASMLNTEASGFNRFTDAIRNIADIAPVAMVYGTPSHDTDGSLEIFRKLATRYGITILEPGQVYFLGNGFITNDEEAAQKSIECLEPPKAILFGIPEPRKKYLLADATAGKDETEEAIRAAMHRLCFMLAAKRKKYPNIPCIVLYHGDVAGASLQNDETIERGTGIAITIDDLNDIGADYYALGHIHKPQQVGNLPAYYAGSIYPKNFGETHKAGFNLVQIDGTASQAEITRVDFPHPQNLKIEVAGNKLGQKFLLPKELKGYKVWLEITCLKDMRPVVNTEGQLQHLLDNGAATGSRVTIRDIPTETVRAIEITAVKTPVEKFSVWAENSAITPAQSVSEKIKIFQNEIALASIEASGEWELVSVRLRGAIGIRNGIKKEEVKINFDNFTPGLIALSGSNGKGKTTLIENCHPFPQLLTRKSKLQDHFFLRDSFREVILRNHMTGMVMKFLIQIDGANKSKACKYFAFRKPADMDNYDAVEGVDGNLKPYEELLARIFGPLDLYLRTAFITQRPPRHLPDLTDATVGEKKALFAELAGIDYLQQFADAAADKMKQELAKSHDAEVRAWTLEAAVCSKAGAVVELKEAETMLATGRHELEIVIEKGNAAKADVERLQTAYAAEKERQWKVTSTNSVIANAKIAIEAREKDIAYYQRAAQNKALFEKAVADGESLQKTIDAENVKKQQFLEKNAERQREFTKIKADFDTKVKELEIERDGLRDRRTVLEKNALEVRHNINLYERDAAEINEDCPICGQRLPADKLAELKNKQEQFLEKIKNEKSAEAKLAAEVNAISPRIEELGEEITSLTLDEPSPVKEIPFDDTALIKAVSELRLIDMPAIRAGLANARDAAVHIEGLEREIKTQQAIIADKTAELEKLAAGVEAGYGDRLNAELEAAKCLHAGLTNRYVELKAAIAKSEAVIEAANRKLAEIAAREEELAETKAVEATAKTEAAEWELISRGFGKDGIQALELDALAPGISDTANRILESAYGDRFKITIETTRIGGAGKKAKQIEDFVINVIDSEVGEAVSLDDKSGGEAVWIKRAIYDAFAVIRKRNTNFAFLTCFQDETDGALDSAAKVAYCRMLEATHAESKLRHTIIITHSSEVKAMIEQKIEIENL